MPALKENRVFEMGRFGWPFRQASDLLLGFCRLCPTVYAPPRVFLATFFCQDALYDTQLTGCHRVDD